MVYIELEINGHEMTMCIKRLKMVDNVHDWMSNMSIFIDLEMNEFLEKRIFICIKAMQLWRYFWKEQQEKLWGNHIIQG